MAPISIRQLTSAYELRYQNTSHVPHRNFSEGMIRDIASWEAPEGAMWDASDILCDLVGKARKRGGTSVPLGTNRTAVISRLSGFRSGSLDALTGLVGVLGTTSGAAAYSISRTTGAATSLSLAASGGPVGSLGSSIMAKPFQHRSYMVLPLRNNDGVAASTNSVCFWGGSTAANQGGANGVITANSNQITGMTSGTLTSSNVGQFIYVAKPGTPQYYLGRVVAVLSGTSVQVEPIPTVSFTGTAWSTVPIWSPDSAVGSNTAVPVGKYAVSFQGRIVQANIATTLAAPGLGAIDFQPYRVMWSKLQNEVTGPQYDGDQVLYPFALAQQYNYVDLPSARNITGLAVAGENQLIIFSDRATFRITGSLDTETIANPAFDFAAGQVSANVGCIDAGSIQNAKGGVIFAALDNIYEYDGAAMRPLLTGRNQRYYQARIGTTGDTVYGSAYFPNQNHYYLSLSGTGGLLINLDTLAMTRLTGVATQVFDSTADPVTPTQVFGTRWWDTTGAAPTMTNGFLQRLDPFFVPAQANASDGDGTAVLPTIQTKSYQDGNLESNKLFTQLHVDYALQGTGSPTATVTADTKLNTSEASYQTLTQGTLANTGTGSGVQHMDVTNQLAEGKAIEVKIAVNAACATFELNGLNIGMQQRALT